MKSNQMCTTHAAIPTMPEVCLSDRRCTSKECCPTDPVSATWLDAALARSSQLQPRWEADPSITSNTDAITAWCSFKNIDLTLYTAAISCSVDFWGRYINGTAFVADAQLPSNYGSSNASSFSNTTLVLLLGGFKIELKHGDDARTGAEFSIGAGNRWRHKHVDAEYYPHTNLPFDLRFTAWWSTADGIVNSLVSEPPFVVDLDFNYIPFYTVSNTRCHNITSKAGLYKGQPNVTWYSIQGFLHLSDTAKQGVEWMNACMWALSAITCMLTLTWCALAGPHAALAADF